MVLSLGILSFSLPVAGWSSPVARQAHNLKVVGSNPTPATKEINVFRTFLEIRKIAGYTSSIL